MPVPTQAPIADPMRFPVPKSTTVQQAGVLAWRMQRSMMEILLVTRASTEGWTLPKGTCKAHLEDHENAAREASEEAGIVGPVSSICVSSFSYSKNEKQYEVSLFPMTVSCELDYWEESDTRQRRWFTIGQALTLDMRTPVLQVISNLPELLQSMESAQAVGRHAIWMPQPTRTVAA